MMTADAPDVEEDADFVDGVLQRIGDFDYSDINERMKAQSVVYLMQAFGVGAGYGFSWPGYAAGPRSNELYEVLHVLEGREEDAPVRRFSEESVEERFIEFSDYAGPRLKDLDRMEIASAVHFTADRYSLTDPDLLLPRAMRVRGEGERVREDWEAYREELRALADYEVLRGTCYL